MDRSPCTYDCHRRAASGVTEISGPGEVKKLWCMLRKCSITRLYFAEWMASRYTRGALFKPAYQVCHIHSITLSVIILRLLHDFNPAFKFRLLFSFRYLQQICSSHL